MTLKSRNWLALAGLVLLAAAAAVFGGRDDQHAASFAASVEQAASLRSNAQAATAATPVRGREGFVGSAACAACHQAQSDAYVGSHHGKALVTPSPEMAKARFDGAHFTSQLGGTTKFALGQAGPVVSSVGADGKSQTFALAYVSGVWPLEQYVVQTERGKLQALGVAWDSRTAAEGGNRWFHVYGADGIAPRDPLFFTAATQNWNHVCADCHSTWVERRYDVAKDAFDSRWAEPAVGCEACHGPGAEHVRTAKATGRPTPFAVRLKLSEPWLPSASGSPTPRSQDDAEVEVCAPCHSRRKPLKEGFLASDPFLDSFEPELLWPGRYHADGQVEGEVYEWGSFLQSRMHRAGVRCSDCHDAHAGKLHAPGNALCVRCHEPARFDVPAHSHHGGENSARCIDCHMPPATFMQVDERRDHSIRIPRPDRSVELGTPNACNACHTKRSASWARDAVAQWFPASHERKQFGEALARDRKGTLDAERSLRELAEEPSAPSIARATALERLGAYPAEQTLRSLQKGLASPDPLVVFGAALGAAKLPPAQRASLLLPALRHKARAVRIAASKALAGAPLAQLPPTDRAAVERGFAEVEQSFAVSSSRAETHVERSAFELARGQLSKAEASLALALRLEPCLAEAHLNSADLQRQRGQEAAAERAIRAALGCSPKNAAAHHALGLWQVRAHQTDAALASLQRAVELAPTDTRFSYVLAVALAEAGQRAQAIRVLKATLKHRPNDAAARQTLASLTSPARP